MGSITEVIKGGSRTVHYSSHEVFQKCETLRDTAGVLGL